MVSYLFTVPYQDWAGFEEELGKHISLAVPEAEQADFEHPLVKKRFLI
jgi:hypothetical protein